MVCVGVMLSSTASFAMRSFRTMRAKHIIFLVSSIYHIVPFIELFVNSQVCWLLCQLDLKYPCFHQLACCQDSKIVELVHVIDFGLRYFAFRPVEQERVQYFYR
jgi:hypothetical protein